MRFVVIIALTLLGYYCLSPVYGFVPAAYLSWALKGISFSLKGTITHPDMTRMAVLTVAREFLLDNPNNQNPGSSGRILGLGTSIDESKLVSAYYGRQEKGIESNFRSVIKTMQDANAEVDLGSEEKLAEAHFDSEQFQAGQNRLILLRDTVVSSIKLENYQEARTETGRMLHTLQDFYSHSNWVENGNENIYQILGRRNLRPSPIAEADQETCMDCPESGTVVLGRVIELFTALDTFFGSIFIDDYDVTRRSAKKFYSCSDNLHDSLKRQGILTSGYYGGSQDSNYQVISKPRGKCSHGGFLDPTSDQFAKGGINKDSPHDKWSPHHNHYEMAVALAKEATEDIFREIRRDVNDDALFAMYLGLAVDAVSASIAYVIDTTSSMGDELPEIQQTIPQIRSNLQQYAELNGNMTIRYILVPFNDPDPGDIFETQDIEQFLSAIGQLTADGGGDPPEPSIGAIIRAAEVSEPNSPIFVYTDAPASDPDHLNRAAVLISEKNLQVNFIYVSSFKKRRSITPMQRINSRAKRQTVDDVYEQLATLSGGQVLTVNTDDISETASLVSFSVMRSRSIIFELETTTFAPMQHVFSVDSFVAEVFISIDAAQSISVLVTNPQGMDADSLAQYSVTLNTSSLLMANINVTENNLRGNWTLAISTSGFYSIKVLVTSESMISSDLYNYDPTNPYGFSIIDGRPSNGVPIIVLFDIVSESDIPVTVSTLNLLGDGGNQLQSISNITTLSDNEFAAVFLPPFESFQLQVVGVDGNGYNYSRITDTSIRSTPVSIRLGESSAAFLTMRPGDNHTIKLILINGDQNSRYFHLMVTIEEMGNSTNFTAYEIPPMVTTDFNSSTNIDLQLVVCENALDGYAATITILAESTNDRDANDYVNLNMIVTTAPPPEFTENKGSTAIRALPTTTMLILIAGCMLLRFFIA